MHKHDLIITQSTTHAEIVAFFERFRAEWDQWHSDWTAECAEHELNNHSGWAYSSSLACSRAVYPWAKSDIQSIIDLAKAYQRVGKGNGGSYRQYLFERSWEIISQVTGACQFGHPRIFFR